MNSFNCKEIVMTSGEKIGETKFDVKFHFFNFSVESVEAGERGEMEIK